MAIKYFLRDTTDDATCDKGTAADNDMDQTQGTPTTQTHDAVGLTEPTYVEVGTYDENVSSDDPSGTDFDTSVSIGTHNNSNFRWRIQEIDSASCGTPVQSSPYSTVRTTTGTFTETLTLPGVWTSGNILRLSVEAHELSTHGNRRSIWDVNDVDTWVQGNDFGGAAPARRVIVVS